MPENNMMWQQAAANTAQGALGIGIQRLGAKYDRKQQLKTQQAMQEMQIRGSKELTDYNQMKQMDMWKMTGPVGQMEQYKLAGLNPGLIYGMSGGGGQSSNIQQGNVSGGQAGYVDTTTPALGMAMQMRAQLALLQAQKENIQADTANKQADVPVKGAQVPNIQADTQLKGSQKELIDTEQAIASIRNAVAGATQNAEIAKIMAGLKIISNDASISDQTKQSTINRIKAEAIGAGLENILTNAKTANMNQDTKLKWQQVEETIGRIKQMVATIDIERNRTEIMREANKLKEQSNDLNDPNLTPQISSIVTGVIGAILGSARSIKEATTPIKGFHNRQ